MRVADELYLQQKYAVTSLYDSIVMMPIMGLDSLRCSLLLHKSKFEI